MRLVQPARRVCWDRLAQRGPPDLRERRVTPDQGDRKELRVTSGRRDLKGPPVTLGLRVLLAALVRKAILDPREPRET